MCNTTIFADPDIGGPGVIGSFLVTGWITCFIALTNSWCVITAHPEKLVLKPRYRGNATPQRALPLSWVSKKILALKPADKMQWPRLELFTRASLVCLSDIQLLNGTAILIAGTAQIKTMSGYHQTLVFDFWFLALNSYFSTYHRLPYVLRFGRKSWRYWTRRVLEFVNLVLALNYSLLLTFQSETSCYNTHSEASGLFIQIVYWTWFAGTVGFIIYLGATLLVELVAIISPDHTWIRSTYPQAITKLATMMEEGKGRWLVLVTRLLYLPPSPIDPLCTCEGAYSWSDSHIHTRHRFGKALHYVLLLLLRYLVPFLGNLVIQLVLVSGPGSAESMFTVFVALAFTTWNTYIIIDLKVSNAVLLDRSEMQWGFGQVLAVGLLAALFLQLLEAAKESREHVPRVDAENHEGLAEESHAAGAESGSLVEHTESHQGSDEESHAGVTRAEGDSLVNHTENQAEGENATVLVPSDEHSAVEDSSTVQILLPTPAGYKKLSSLRLRSTY